MDIPQLCIDDASYVPILYCQQVMFSSKMTMSYRDDFPLNSTEYTTKSMSNGNRYLLGLIGRRSLTPKKRGDWFAGPTSIS